MFSCCQDECQKCRYSLPQSGATAGHAERPQRQRTLCLFACSLPLFFSVYVSLPLFVCMYVYLCESPSVCLGVCVSLSLCLPVCLSLRICVFVCVCVCVSVCVCLSVCLSVCLHPSVVLVSMCSPVTLEFFQENDLLELCLEVAKLRLRGSVFACLPPSGSPVSLSLFFWLRSAILLVCARARWCTNTYIVVCLCDCTEKHRKNVFVLDWPRMYV